MAQIPDITESALWVMKPLVKERYGREVEIQLADSDIRFHVSDHELTTCPVIDGTADDSCHFVIFKTGGRGYRCQLF